MNSFFPNGVKSWNNVIVHFQNTPSTNILKYHILSLIRPVKISIFNIHDPLGLRYLFYLRLGLSPLKSHKNILGFADTPLKNCLCNHGVEDTNHFLFLCPFYAAQRAALIASVIVISQKYNLEHLINDSNLYLYGHQIIVFADNKQILLSTINFIKKTERFST